MMLTGCVKIVRSIAHMAYMPYICSVNKNKPKQPKVMKTYRILRSTDHYTASRHGVKTTEVLRSNLDREEALAEMSRLAQESTFTNDDYAWIPDIDTAQAWLDEIADDDTQADRQDWLRDIIANNRCGLYNLDGPAVYTIGDTGFRNDVFDYSIEEDA